MVTKSDTESLQVEIIPQRYLMPDTTQKLLNAIYENGGLTRIMVQGPNLPRNVPYGPGRGAPIDENRDLLIEVAGQVFELKVKVGRVRLELEAEKYFNGLKEACERALPFPVHLKRGKFFHTKQTLTDYAKFGEVEDSRILGLIDPKAKKDRMAMLSEGKVTVNDEER